MLDSNGIKSIAKGLLTFIPGLRGRRTREGGGANSARYCYSVWMRHLVLARKSGLTSQPDVVAEFGPGDSIGAGLAALLSGSSSLLCFDAVPFASNSGNSRIFEELLKLFMDRSPIPGMGEFPKISPRLDSYAFPLDTIPAAILGKALDEGRTRAIRGAIAKGGNQSGETAIIRYIAPWNAQDAAAEGTVDMLFSQAVMEHVDDLEAAYAAMHRWLKPGGAMSHEIDFKSHGTASVWNGHWGYSDATWKIIRGRRPYFLNRLPCGDHVGLIEKAGFEITHLSRQEEESILRSSLCGRLAGMSDLDLRTSSAHVIAVKRG